MYHTFAKFRVLLLMPTAWTGLENAASQWIQEFRSIGFLFLFGVAGIICFCLTFLGSEGKEKSKAEDRKTVHLRVLLGEPSF